MELKMLGLCGNTDPGAYCAFIEKRNVKGWRNQSFIWVKCCHLTLWLRLTESNAVLGNPSSIAWLGKRKLCSSKSIWCQIPTFLANIWAQNVLRKLLSLCELNCKMGSDCSTAVKWTPQNRDVMGSILSGAGLFSSSILSNVSLNRSLEEVQHYCFSLKTKNS